MKEVFGFSSWSILHVGENSVLRLLCSTIAHLTRFEQIFIKVYRWITIKSMQTFFFPRKTSKDPASFVWRGHECVLEGETPSSVPDVSWHCVPSLLLSFKRSLWASRVSIRETSSGLITKLKWRWRLFLLHRLHKVIPNLFALWV